MEGSSALHAAALVGALVVVGMEKDIEIGLELREILVTGLAALDAEVFVEQCAVESFEVAVALGSTDLGGRCSMPLS